MKICTILQLIKVHRCIITVLHTLPRVCVCICLCDCSTSSWHSLSPTVHPHEASSWHVNLVRACTTFASYSTYTQFVHAGQLYTAASQGSGVSWLTWALAQPMQQLRTTSICNRFNEYHKFHTRVQWALLQSKRPALRENIDSVTSLHNQPAEELDTRP